MILAARVAVLSDDTIFRHGLENILAEELHVANGPEIVLVDSRLEDAFQLCLEMRRKHGKSVIFVAAPENDEWASRAIGAGARGIVFRAAPLTEILRAIAVVRDGLIWAPRRVMAATIDWLTASAKSNRGALEALLSARERQVLHQAIRGLGNKELAGNLDISEATVKVHMTKIFRKLGVTSRSELTAHYFSA